jgi:uncharacterized protein YneF (UPF0154 family)
MLVRFQVLSKKTQLILLFLGMVLLIGSLVAIYFIIKPKKKDLNEPPPFSDSGSTLVPIQVKD